MVAIGSDGAGGGVIDTSLWPLTVIQCSHPNLPGLLVAIPFDLIVSTLPSRWLYSPNVFTGLYIEPSDSNPASPLAHGLCVWFPVFDLWTSPHGRGLGWVLCFFPKPGIWPCPRFNQRPPNCRHSCQSPGHTHPIKTEKEGRNRVGRREGRRRKKSMKEERALAILP